MTTAVSRIDDLKARAVDADDLISLGEARSRALAHYNLGVPCKNGHLSVRFVSNRACKACLDARKMAVRTADPERVRRQWRIWQAANRTRLRALERARYQATLGIARAKNREKERRRRERDGERIAALARISAKRFREEHREEWRARKREEACRQRVRRRKADGAHTADDVQRIRKMQRGKCAICAIKLGRAAHLDHIIALARGGSNWPSNLQWLCARCNISKNARDPLDYMRSLGRLL